MIFRPLFDASGGPAMAFRCEVILENGTPEVPVKCNRLVSTMKGLRIHRRIVHHLADQIELPFAAMEPEPPLPAEKRQHEKSRSTTSPRLHRGDSKTRTKKPKGRSTRSGK